MQANNHETRDVDWDVFWERVSFDSYVEKETYHDRLIHARLKYWIANTCPMTPIRRFLEIGGAYSKVLYRLSEEAGCGIELYGLDNSERTARRTGEKFARRNIKIVVGDIFNSPLQSASLQFVASFGLIEHFPDPTDYLDKCHEILAPGGRLVVGYPSYCGITGYLQRRINPAAFDFHFSQPAERMREIITRTGFSEVKAEYFGLFNPNMIDWGESRAARFVMYCCFTAVRPLEWLGRITGRSYSGKWSSSYVIATGVKSPVE
ncbi:MAG: methyltransferase domain-containing protein [Candidatus Glassbacteria bacterium]